MSLTFDEKACFVGVFLYQIPSIIYTIKDIKIRFCNNDTKSDRINIPTRNINNIYEILFNTTLIDLSNINLDLLFYIIMLILYYILLRSLCLILNFYLNFKYITSNFEDITQIIIRGFIIYYFGDIELNRLNNINNQRKFYLFILFYLIFYGLIYNICPKNITFETNSNGKSNTFMFICVAIITIIFHLFILVDNIVYFIRKKPLYIGLFIIILLSHIIVLICDVDNIKIHIHHHYWAFIISIFVQSNKESSLVIQSMLIAVFIHGIALFGCEPIYQTCDPILES